ncbi:MAG: phasin family protein [Proteobacteria bacterium]|nr:phasin family protein [Pseudomonadota bacterium]
MSVSPEQFVATSKANIEAGLKTATSFATTLFAAVERVASLNLATARGAFDDGLAFSKAVLAAKDPKALAALQLGAITPAVEKSVAYGRSLSDIGGDAQEELTKLVEAEAAVLSKNIDTALEGIFKNAPAGSEPAIKAVKTALANASSAYEGAAKAAKQVAAAAQASVEKATLVAVESVDKGTKAAASALKVA